MPQLKKNIWWIRNSCKLWENSGNVSTVLREAYLSVFNPNAEEYRLEKLRIQTLSRNVLLNFFNNVLQFFHIIYVGCNNKHPNACLDIVFLKISQESLRILSSTHFYVRFGEMHFYLLNIYVLSKIKNNCLTKFTPCRTNEILHISSFPYSAAIHSTIKFFLINPETFTLCLKFYHIIAHGWFSWVLFTLILIFLWIMGKCYVISNMPWWLPRKKIWQLMALTYGPSGPINGR